MKESDVLIPIETSMCDLQHFHSEINSSISSVNFDGCCRICTKENDNLISIFGRESKKSKIHYKIQSYLLIKVYEGDGLPQSVCGSCISQIELSHSHALLAQKSDRWLRDIFSKTQAEENAPNSKNTEETNNIIVKVDPVDIFYQDASDHESIDNTATFCSDNEEFPSNYNNVQHCLENNLEYENTGTIDFKCPVCNIHFEEKSNVKKHCSKEHKKFLCEICFNLFQSYNQLFKHSQTVHKIKIRKRRKNKPRLTIKRNPKTKSKITVEEENDPEKIKCKMCTKKLNKEMILIHAKERHRRTLCPYCFDFIGYYNDVKDHCLTIHNSALRKKKEYSLVCDICGKICIKKEQFRYHLKKHNMPQEKKFQCIICKKKFVRSTRLDKHMSLLHIDGKNFECDICNKIFSDRYNLKVHKLTVHTERNILCHYCDKKFKSQKNLSAHIEKQHDTKWIYNCTICHITYTKENDSLEHYENFHNENEKNQNYSNNAFYKTSQFGCDICAKYWGSRLALQIHMKRKHGIGARDLGNTEKLKAAMNSNLKSLISYKCNNCPKIFTTKFQIRAHIKMHLDTSF